MPLYSAIVPCPMLSVTPIVVSYGTLLLCYCALSYVVEKFCIYRVVAFDAIVGCVLLHYNANLFGKVVASSML